MIFHREPQSAFYKSPLIVLDFQSLYPSIMIAYNYCYSTCLGRIQKFKGTNKLGFSELKLPPGLLGELKDHIHSTLHLMTEPASDFDGQSNPVAPEWDDVCEDNSAQKPFSKDVGRTSRYSCNGQASHEVC